MPVDANATRRLLINARWARENLRAIAAYNQRIERCGVFSDGLRRF
ncbi:MAG: type II toxin-antitoxin system CcdA family antitoxin [Burkholderiales bacterium]